MVAVENSRYNFLMSRDKVQNFTEKTVDKPYGRDEIGEDLMLSGVRHVWNLPWKKQLHKGNSNCLKF